MKKVLIVFYLSLLPFTFANSQSEEDSDYKSNLENIFKVNTLKYRYDAIESLYKTLDIHDSMGVCKRPNFSWFYTSMVLDTCSKYIAIKFFESF